MSPQDEPSKEEETKEHPKSGKPPKKGLMDVDEVDGMLEEMMKGGDIDFPEEDGRTTFADLNAEEAFDMAEVMMNMKATPSDSVY